VRWSDLQRWAADLLSNRLRARVEASAPVVATVTSPAATQKALDAFVSAFEAKWRSRTTCAPAYVWHKECANWDGTPEG
jgi:hypothetical protein